MGWTDFKVGNIPILGDIHKSVFGDPDAIKSAYDKQIQASKDAQQQMQGFLMGQKGQAQAFYNPLQHMFQSAYGTEGMQAPQTPAMQQAPAAPQPGPLNRMYGGK